MPHRQLFNRFAKLTKKDIDAFLVDEKTSFFFGAKRLGLLANSTSPLPYTKCKTCAFFTKNITHRPRAIVNGFFGIFNIR